MKRSIGHADSCKGGRCRGGCWKSNDIASFSIDKSAIGRKKDDNILLVTGKEGVGKSAWAVNMIHEFGTRGLGSYRDYVKQEKDSHPGGVVKFDMSSYYEKMKTDALQQRGAEAIVKKQAEDLANPATDPLYLSYLRGKAEKITAALDQNERESRSRFIWETLGRLLGKAYAESDTAFFAFLEGFDRGRTNEDQGRPALGRRREE